MYDYAGTFTGDELFIGPPVYSDGTRYRGAPDQTPANWDKLDVTRLANQLSGHLLIIYADLDENALPNQAFRMIDALTRANKPYDLIDLQNRNHQGGANDGYTIKRTWDYSSSTCMVSRRRGITRLSSRSRSSHSSFFTSSRRAGLLPPLREAAPISAAPRRPLPSDASLAGGFAPRSSAHHRPNTRASAARRRGKGTLSRPRGRSPWNRRRHHRSPNRSRYGRCLSPCGCGRCGPPSPRSCRGDAITLSHSRYPCEWPHPYRNGYAGLSAL